MSEICLVYAILLCEWQFNRAASGSGDEYLTILLFKVLQEAWAMK